jgi:hypothetical protein
MPKYIKDGAYTIVVDDRSASTKRISSPKNNDSDSDEDHEGSKTERNEEEEEQEWGLGDDMPMEEEEIDYADPSFILQNLSIVTPNFDNDKTCLLPGRKDLAEVIASQVRFYCYCAIDAFSRCPKPITILVIGEGFIGARIINDLIANGCKDMLRICTRGDLTAEEWTTRGIKANNDLASLLDGVAPDIIILTVENASFAGICRQLTSLYAVTAATFIISCSFGFQRRKLHTQLRTPNIFRTFVEPDEIFAVYKKKAFHSITAYSKSGKELPPAPLVKPHVALPDEIVSQDEFNGASFLATRSLDIRNIIYQMENFYAIHHHGFSEARAKALKNVLGYRMPPSALEVEVKTLAAVAAAAAPSPSKRRSSMDESFEQMSLRKAQKTEAKLKARVDSALKKLSSYNACAHTYQKYFARLVTETELQALIDQQFTAEENNPKSGPTLGFERHRTPANGAPRKAISDLPGRPMYGLNIIEAIFRNDEDYSSFTGPGFDLMASWDKKSGKSEPPSPLKKLQQLSEAPEVVAKVLASHIPPRPVVMTSQPRASVELDEDAKKELEEFGRRMSAFVDTEATKIDRNYMQKYLEVSSKF